MSKKVRLNVFLPESVAGKIEVMAKDLGLSKTHVAGLAIQAGIDAISLAINPDWKAYFEAMIKAGKIPQINYVEMEMEEDGDISTN